MPSAVLAGAGSDGTDGVCVCVCALFSWANLERARGAVFGRCALGVARHSL